MSAQMLGHFQIEHLLGEGGIGQVYAALDMELGRHVAIKTLRPEFARDRGFVDRFRGEAASLARLTHTNITTLYSLHRGERLVYMVMELVKGRTLEELLERVPRLPVRESLAIVVQAGSGLGYAHRMGVIHRDIKPANLMLTEVGSLKIMDFGIARIRGSQRMTRAGSIIGTLAYMPPEQIRGEEGDERSDIYSLGCVLYEMLSGSPPFHADTEYDLIKAQVEKKPPPLRSRLPDLPLQVEETLMKALAKAPGDRFATIQQFSQALGAVAIEHEATEILRQRYVASLATLPAAAQKPPPPILGAGKEPAAPKSKPPRRPSGGSSIPWHVVALGGAAAVVIVGIGLLIAGQGGAPDAPSSGIRAENVPSTQTAASNKSSSIFFPPPDSSSQAGASRVACSPAHLDAAQIAISGNVTEYTQDGWPRINGTDVPLFGVNKVFVSHREEISGWMAAHQPLQCQACGQGTYQCRASTNGSDVSRTFLLNGIATAADNAPKEYLDAQDKAREKRVGIWKQ